MAGPDEEAVRLLPSGQEEQGRTSIESVSEASTTSLVFERIGERVVAGNEKPINGHGSMGTPKHHTGGQHQPYADDGYVDGEPADTILEDEENGDLKDAAARKSVDKRFRRLLWVVGGVFIGAWLVALGLFLWSQAYRHSSAIPHNPTATASRGNGRKVTLDQVMGQQWRPRKQGISWIEGANGEDGLLLEHGVPGKDYLVVEDIRASKSSDGATSDSTTKEYLSEGCIQART
jgi:dipeptidyl aminopeptidase